ncbi:MAG: UbiD family decarboxylase domain-containing protein [Gammaproteobacteria bacterium]
MSTKKPEHALDNQSRREFLGSTATASVLGALAAAGYTQQANASTPLVASGASGLGKNAPRAPFDSLRDWTAAMEAHGLLMRFDRIDQDQFEIPALFFKATDLFTMYGAPCMMFDKVKIEGKWVDGPVLINTQGHWNADAIIWNLPIVPGDHYATYRSAVAYIEQVFADNDNVLPEIAPVEVKAKKAPVKEVIVKGDDIDINKFAFVKTNPADAGRYVNTGSHFMVDPELGANFGTYRAQIKGPRKLGINPEPNQTGYKMLMAARDRGETSMSYSIVLGQDPVVWMLSGTRLAPRGFGKTPKPADELAIAGGLRGKAVEVVKSENTDIMVPAHAEMVIEGTIDLREESFEPEGPFGEMFGYLGPVKEKNFVMTIDTITHRKKPWIMNAMTGMQRGYVTSGIDAAYSISLRKQIPQFVAYTNPQDTMGIVVLSIDKTGPGQGIKSGMAIARRNPIAKIVIVVDKDINIYDRTDVMFAVGSRWQPDPASEIISETLGLMTDPSQVKYARTSKIVIDATRQLPEEGGKADFAKTNRELLKAGAPDAFGRVREAFGDALENWKRV